MAECLKAHSARFALLAVYDSEMAIYGPVSLTPAIYGREIPCQSAASHPKI